MQCRVAGARRLDGVAERLIADKLAVADRDVDPRVILVDDTAGADVQVPDFGIAHLAFGKADAGSDASIVVCGHVASSRRQFGASARVIALSGASSRHPKPSRIQQHRGARSGC